MSNKPKVKVKIAHVVKNHKHRIFGTAAAAFLVGNYVVQRDYDGDMEAVYKMNANAINKVVEREILEARREVAEKAIELTNADYITARQIRKFARESL